MDAGVCVISSLQVGCEGRSVEPVCADSWLRPRASGQRSPCKQTSRPTHPSSTAALLYGNTLPAFLLGFLVPQQHHSSANTSPV